MTTDSPQSVAAHKCWWTATKLMMCHALVGWVLHYYFRMNNICSLCDSTPLLPLHSFSSYLNFIDLLFLCIYYVSYFLQREHRAFFSQWIILQKAIPERKWYLLCSLEDLILKPEVGRLPCLCKAAFVLRGCVYSTKPFCHAHRPH